MPLPSNEYTFNITEEIGSGSGELYSGQFTVVLVPTVRQKHAIELEITRLNGGYATPSEGLQGMSEILANTKVRIIKAPDWWYAPEFNCGYDTIDDNIVVIVWNMIKKQQAEWHAKIIQKALDSKKPEDKNPITP